MVMIIFMAMNLLGISSWYKRRKLETTIWAIQLLLLSAGIISTVLVFKSAVIPYSFNIVTCTLPGLWTALKSWLSPPYIYIIINFIIVFIVASSAFHHPRVNEDHCNDEDYGGPRLQPQVSPKSEEINQNYFLMTAVVVPTTTLDPPPVAVCFNKSPQPQPLQDFLEKKILTVESIKISNSDNFKHISETEPPANNHHLHHNHQDNKGDIENEGTMEATWKAIIEGGKSPTKRHLKKSETWNVPPPQVVEVVPPEEEVAEVISMAGLRWKELRKSETFNDSELVRQRGGLTRDASMSQDELNQRAEEFIKKFNTDMRLQRQESERRFLEMINR